MRFRVSLTSSMCAPMWSVICVTSLTEKRIGESAADMSPKALR